MMFKDLLLPEDEVNEAFETVALAFHRMIGFIASGHFAGEELDSIIEVANQTLEAKPSWPPTRQMKNRPLWPVLKGFVVLPEFLKKESCRMRMWY